MSRLLVGDGRTHVDSSLMGESLQDRSVLEGTDQGPERAIFPDIVLVGIGGRSIFDRGREALVPLAEELAAVKAHHKLVVGVGGGTRVRHTLSIALDLGLPTGGMAQLVGAMEECNALLLTALLADHGAIPLQREHFWDLPMLHETGMLPIAISIPPYHFWEPPPEVGPLPMHGSDFGLFVHAEVLGMRRVIFVKDEDGLYDCDPKLHPGARLIEETTLSELLADLPSELILDRALFHTWKASRHVQEVRIVNGLVPGALTRALAGERVGSVIRRGDA